MLAASIEGVLMLSSQSIEPFSGIKTLFQIGAPTACGGMDSLVVSELLPLYCSVTTASTDYEKLVYVIEGALEALDEHGLEVTVPKGGSFLASRKDGTWLGFINPSPSEPARFVEIDFEPRPVPELTYETMRPDHQRKGGSRLLASPSGFGQSMALRRDVSVYSASLREGHVVRHEFEAPWRAAWFFVAKGW